MEAAISQGRVADGDLTLFVSIRDRWIYACAVKDGGMWHVHPQHDAFGEPVSPELAALWREADAAARLADWLAEEEKPRPAEREPYWAGQLSTRYLPASCYADMIDRRLYEVTAETAVRFLDRWLPGWEQAVGPDFRLFARPSLVDALIYEAEVASTRARRRDFVDERARADGQRFLRFMAEEWQFRRAVKMDG